MLPSEFRLSTLCYTSVYKSVKHIFFKKKNYKKIEELMISKREGWNLYRLPQSWGEGGGAIEFAPIAASAVLLSTVCHYPCYISTLLFTSCGPIFRPSTLVGMLKVLYRNFLHVKKKKRTELGFFFR